jgi:hypothetical protein
MAERCGAYRVLVVKPEERSLGRHRKEDNIAMDLREVKWRY